MNTGVDGETGAHLQNDAQWAAKWERQKSVSQKAEEARISKYELIKWLSLPVVPKRLNKTEKWVCGMWQRGNC